jgi:hypothetical protein
MYSTAAINVGNSALDMDVDRYYWTLPKGNTDILRLY